MKQNASLRMKQLVKLREAVKNMAKLLKAVFPCLFMELIAARLGQVYRMSSGFDVSDRIFGAFLEQ